MFSENFIKKSNNVVSGKLTRFGHSYWEERLANPENTLNPPPPPTKEVGIQIFKKKIKFKFSEKL